MAVWTEISNLESSSYYFKNNMDPPAWDHFNRVSNDNKNMVYRQTWMNRCQPMGTPEYGRIVFNCIGGSYSSSAERAEIIDDYVRKLREENQNPNTRTSSSREGAGLGALLMNDFTSVLINKAWDHNVVYNGPWRENSPPPNLYVPSNEYSSLKEENVAKAVAAAIGGVGLIGAIGCIFGCCKSLRK
jgi:hypothetical protein